ncbi:caspase recruitment domain-containing protein 11-like, partial [Notothenia coriiceps]|uniref:Caspase recruitment domain-containing protein 11-like n=1 Tax=Notothenia coriiceps TaxID=8208 RepID=A0A6I9NGR1_9TELE
NNKLREERNNYSDELLRVKDENYKLAMRYATLSEEKNMAVMRSRDLQLVVLMNVGTPDPLQPRHPPAGPRGGGPSSCVRCAHRSGKNHHPENTQQWGSHGLSYLQTDTLSKEEFHLKQNVEPFIHYKEKQATFECITRENIEAVASKGKHCLLEAELSCVKDLLRREIYPIIIYVKICDKNVKKLRKLPLRVESEEGFVKSCRAKVKELEGVPCLYGSVEPEAWAGPDDLIRVIKERILEEQKKTVWVEQDLL